MQLLRKRSSETSKTSYVQKDAFPCRCFCLSRGSTGILGLGRMFRRCLDTFCNFSKCLTSVSEWLPSKDWRWWLKDNLLPRVQEGHPWHWPWTWRARLQGKITTTKAIYQYKYYLVGLITRLRDCHFNSMHSTSLLRSSSHGLIRMAVGQYLLMSFSSQYG